MLKEAPECPKCHSQKVWKYGSRKREPTVLKKFLCTVCGYVWETETLQMWSISPELVKPIMKLMERAIGDSERGVPSMEQGWAGFDDETVEALLRTGLCERDVKTRKIRILSSAKLPEDLASLETAKTFLDIRRAEKVVRELEEVWRGQGRYEAVLRGLVWMLESGIRTISPVRLEGGKICSWDWFSLAHRAVNSLVLTATEKMWKDDGEKLEMARKFLGDRVRRAEDVEKVLRWRDFVGRLEREALETLGFLWFADMHLQQVKDPVAKRIALRSLLKVVGTETLKKIEEVLAETEVSYINFPWW